MTPDSTTFHDLANDTPGVTSQVREAASQVKEKVSELGRASVQKINSNRQTAARGIESAANVLHEKAENLPGGEKVTNMAHSAAHKLKSTAEYVREHDIGNMMTDVGECVKRNPIPSLLTAGIIGFIVGRALGPSD